jgi:dTDP-4-dehydrorhamnose reductase
LIGSHLFRVGQERGAPVIGTCYSQCAPGLQSLDVTDPSAVAALLRTLRPGLIFLPAANPNVDLCETDPTATRRVNVEPVRTVAELASELRSRVVFYSSDYVFDGHAGPYVEGDVPNPLSKYGQQKLEAENLLRSILPDAHLILRVTVVYGWERQGKNFVARLVRTLRQGNTLRAPADQVGSPSLVDDIAEASWMLAEQGARGTLHLAGPDLVDRFAFARHAAQVFGLDAGLIQPVATAELGQAAPRPLRAGMISHRAETLLNRRLVGIAEGLASLREQHWT